MKRVRDPLDPTKGLLMVTLEEWNDLKRLRADQRWLQMLLRAAVADQNHGEEGSEVGMRLPAILSALAENSKAGNTQ